MAALNPPVDPTLERLLRVAVLAARTLDGEHGAAPHLHLGDPRSPGPPTHQVVPTEDPLRPPGCRRRAARGRPEPLDDALRADVVAALLGDLRTTSLRRLPDLPGAARAVDAAMRSSPPLAWLTRPGSRSGPETASTIDHDWARAVHRAYSELGLEPVFVVVTPRGWRDPCGTAGRTWSRLRPRGRADDELVRLLRTSDGAVGGCQSQSCTGTLECIRSR